jgi:hypothetical protein
MNEWEPCTPLVGEPDQWDADQVALRRRRSGVAQALDDLRAVAVHHQRDPEQALAEWEAFARTAGADDMPTFNAFVRDWDPGQQLGLLGFHWPSSLNQAILGGTLRSAPAPRTGRYLVGSINGGPPRPRLTATEARRQVESFALTYGLDGVDLWRQFNDFWQTQSDDLETCLERFLGQLRLARAFQPAIRVIDHFSGQIAEAGQAFNEMARKLAQAGLISLDARILDQLVPRPPGPPLAQELPAEDIRDAIERRCKRCAGDHGSRPCPKTLRGRR